MRGWLWGLAMWLLFNGLCCIDWSPEPVPCLIWVTLPDGIHEQAMACEEDQ